VRNSIPLFCAAFACACLCGCSGRRDSSLPEPSQQALAQAVRNYALGREPDQAREQAFQALLEAAHAAAMTRRGASPETGLSYSLSPRGTVYPFSEVEVVCLVKRADSSQGKALCREFFNAVDAGLDQVIAPR